jgi:hypothetical protein
LPLQNEKRQLETAMVVESRIQMKQKGLTRKSLGETEDSYVASEVWPFDRYMLMSVITLTLQPTAQAGFCRVRAWAY